jgi:transcriptional regulator with XRE-family HTH domain
MASQIPAPQNAQHERPKRTLQRLRRAAGYRSARDFAEKVGIPASTYTRYENRPDGPDKPIPVSAAWAIADELDCTIDAVVGREDVDAPKELYARVKSLSGLGEAMLLDYLTFLEYREQPKARW